MDEVKKEVESLTINKIFGKSIEDMDSNELKENTFELFLMNYDEYEKKLRNSDLNENEDLMEDLSFYFCQDLDMLFNKADVDSKEIVEKVLNEDFEELGDFEKLLKGKYRFLTGYDSSYSVSIRERPIFLRGTFLKEYDKIKEERKQHLIFNGKLKEKHKIKPPEHLRNEVLELNITPYSIDFMDENEIAVLGAEEKVGEEFPRMLLQIYNVKEKELINSVQTALFPNFKGIGQRDVFLGNLSVGSDENIYVNGVREIYNSNLEKINNEMLENANRNRFFQVVENNGVFYCSTYDDGYNFSSKIIKIEDGEENVLLDEFPLSHYVRCNLWDQTPRMVVDDENIYFKAVGIILAMNKNKSMEEVESLPGFLKGELEKSCVPSNHCVDEDQTLYVVTKSPMEICCSIKGYKQKEIEDGRIWNFLTHVYPENFATGWPSLRDMSIKNKKLAYSDLEENKIDFYQLAD